MSNIRIKRRPASSLFYSWCSILLCVCLWWSWWSTSWFQLGLAMCSWTNVQTLIRCLRIEMTIFNGQLWTSSTSISHSQLGFTSATAWITSRAPLTSIRCGRMRPPRFARHTQRMEWVVPLCRCPAVSLTLSWLMWGQCWSQSSSKKSNSTHVTSSSMQLYSLCSSSRISMRAYSH